MPDGDLQVNNRPQEIFKQRSLLFTTLEEVSGTSNSDVTTTVPMDSEEWKWIFELYVDSVSYWISF